MLKFLRKTKISDFKYIEPWVWGRAHWNGTVFLNNPAVKSIPCLGIVFDDIKTGEKIFKRWRKLLGGVDEFDELRVSIIEGLEEFKNVSYVVHVSSEPHNTLARLRSQGNLIDNEFVHVESMIQAEHALEKLEYLRDFRSGYDEFGEYTIVPMSRRTPNSNDYNINYKLSITKGRLNFRRFSDIKKGDRDYVVVSSDVLRKKD